jgi:hypothetical protein
VNEAHARRRGPGNRLNDELKNWKIRSSPNNADKIIAAFRPAPSNPIDLVHDFDA